MSIEDDQPPRKVSIHAPVKGATKLGIEVVKTNCSFNSRSREGSDFSPGLSSRTIDGFNSRSREGSDILSPDGVSYRDSFNSRSREGSDTARSKP